MGFQVVAPTACSSLTALCPQPPGSVRKTSSPARTATASGACGTVMVTMTVATIAMSSVVSAAPGRRAESTAMALEQPKPRTCLGVYVSEAAGGKQARHNRPEPLAITEREPEAQSLHSLGFPWSLQGLCSVLSGWVRPPGAMRVGVRKDVRGSPVGLP